MEGKQSHAWPSRAAQMSAAAPRVCELLCIVVYHLRRTVLSVQSWPGSRGAKSGEPGQVTTQWP